MIFTTKNRVNYIVAGNCAYPAKHPNPPRHGGFNAALDWNEDAARAIGAMVDGSLDRNSVTVRLAGFEWIEVYEYLRSKK